MTDEPETGTDQTGTDQTGTDQTGTDQTGTDQTGTDQTGTDQTGTVTLGVAVAIPEPFATALRRSRAATGDPAAEVVPPHVTIVPPISVPQDEVPEVLDHVRRAVAAVPAFAMRLAGTASFRPVSQVVFVRVAAGADECGQVQQQVREGPLLRSLEFPYHPHVTVAHDVSPDALDQVQSELADFHAEFDVSEVSVYRCAADGVWRVLGDAPLATDPDRP